MKFRYKVMITNLIALSICIGVVGYFMIHNSFELSRKAQIENAIVENNLLQVTTEYELIKVMSKEDYVLEDELSSIGEKVKENIQITESMFYIGYNDVWYNTNSTDMTVLRDVLNEMDNTEKQYVIRQEKEKYYAYVICKDEISFSLLKNVETSEEKTGGNLYIINKYDISKSYINMDEQINYFRLLLGIVIVIESLVMYFISKYLTKPLEELNRITDEIAKGKYDDRVDVSSNDEVGYLANKFNTMAGAIESHVDELNEMIISRDRFVADFTHEIKTPMTSIIGYADTLRSRQIPREDEIKALNYIFSEGVRLEKMSKKLFELIYLKDHQIEKSPINTANIIKTIRSSVDPSLTKKRIKLECEVEEAVIFGNEELLLSVFTNLIDNARKASKEKSTIKVTGKIKDGRYSFHVIDHGIGMSEETLKNVFDEFYMEDKSRSRKEGGAGLGMSLVRIILERHNATWNIKSKKGQGTDIEITLELYRTDEESGQL